MPLVSIIVPIYKVEKYIRECLNSIISQTLTDIEIILVDDGSPDNCPMIVDEYAALDNRIVAIHQKNSGYGCAVNRGLKVASGEYIGIVESDDWIEKNMYEILYSIGQRSKSEIIKGAFFKEYNDGNTAICFLDHIIGNEDVRSLQGFEDIGIMIYESSIWSAIYKRSFLVNNKITMFESKGASYQDVIWKFKTYALVHSITLTKQPFYHYRVLAANSSSASSKNYNAMFINYAEIKAFLIRHNKFEQYKDAFYVHQFFDSVFHLNRLNDTDRKKFIRDASKTFIDANKNNISIKSIPDQYLYNELTQVYETIIHKGKNYFSNRKFRSFLKRIVKLCYKSPLGFLFLKILKKVVNQRHIKTILKESMGIKNEAINGHNLSIDAIEIFKSQPGKHALVLMPWWSTNAACLILREICKMIKNNGYTLHILVTGDAPIDDLWDYSYVVRPTNENYGKWFLPGRDSTLLDSNLIDDWIDDNLLNFVSFINRIYHFSLCFCNYVFLSKPLEFLDSEALKILYTHDVYSGRNARLNSIGIGKDRYYFGTFPEEEKKGIERADYIFAIQKEDAFFFEKLTKKPVVTFPYLPLKQYKSNIYNSGPIKIAYLGSPNPPNIMAIHEYISLIKDMPSVEFYLAGSICNEVHSDGANIKMLGMIDNLNDFYSNYDLYINPDMMVSGLKIKSVEAFSYGRPFICTKAASTGIDVEKIYHKTENIVQVAELTKQCVNNTELLNEMAEESRRVYDKFFSTYSNEDILTTILSKK